MIENLMMNDGINTAISGLFIVFSGLVLIALSIHGFNLVMSRSGNGNNNEETEEEPVPQLAFMHTEPIPDDEMAAITAALELYRKLYFEPLQTTITFKHGELTNSGWKTGFKYGQRASVLTR